jgi:hypothetical protein
MKEQYDKEIKQIQEKKNKIKEREKMIEDQRNDLETALKMDLYQDEELFNVFHEKKLEDLKILSALNDFIKPEPYFSLCVFKDTIHVDHYGLI